MREIQIPINVVHTYKVILMKEITAPQLSHYDKKVRDSDLVLIWKWVENENNFLVFPTYITKKVIPWLISSQPLLNLNLAI